MANSFPDNQGAPGFPPHSNPYAHGGTTGGYQGQPMGQPYPGQNQGDATGGLIPYKNPKALISYYLGIVALLPIIGFPFGIASMVLGILGLKARKANPVIKGSVHAWIGILFGLFSVVFYGLAIVGMIVAIASGPPR